VLKLLRDSDYANITFSERQLAEVIAVGFLTLTKLLRARNRAATDRLAWLLHCVKVARLSLGFGVGGQTGIAGACSAQFASLYRRHAPASACVSDNWGQRGQPGRFYRLCQSKLSGLHP